MIHLSQHFFRPIGIVRLDHQYGKLMAFAFHGDAGRIIDMQIDAKSGRKFRRPTQTDDLLVPFQIDDPLNPNAETGKPGF